MSSRAATTAAGTAAGERGDFLPNLCSVYSVFVLVLVGELLSLVLVMADGGLRLFQWYHLGLVSLLVIWIILVSAACLCSLRPLFKRQSPVVAGLISYAVVLAVTLAFSVAGQMFDGRLDWLQVLTNLIISAVLAGIVLRYFFLQQQLQNQQQAELQARLQALQSRIRPHFLFNSMNSIASLIGSQPALAERMVEDLSGLFRASLSEAGLIPLSRELELCKRFVRIEQLRLGERLRVQWQIPESLPETVQVPSLLLQPLVENAIYHGVQPLPDGGEVVIALTLEAGVCEIQITNPADERHISCGHGLALSNVKHRLLAHYDTRASLDISLVNQTFKAILRFPCAN